MPIHLPTDPTPAPDAVVLREAAAKAAPSPTRDHQFGGLRELISLMRELIDRLDDRMDQLERPPGKE
jgi:hypothetical protein